MASPVMNADFTNASVNGKGMQVLVLASPSEDVALYIGREKKGHAGVSGTPLQCKGIQEETETGSYAAQL